MPDDLEVIAFESAAAFEAWLEEHHTTADGVWFKVAKKGSGPPEVSWDEALDVALCFGWIDGQRKGLDETWYLQRWTPRRKRSIWSKRNVEKVEGLIAAGRMRPAGQEQIDLAKADGRWDRAYDGPKAATVPPDLQTALDASPDAAAAFAGLDAQNRYAILHRLMTAVKPETRARRIEKFVAMLAAGEKLHP